MHKPYDTHNLIRKKVINVSQHNKITKFGKQIEVGNNLQISHHNQINIQYCENAKTYHWHGLVINTHTHIYIYLIWLYFRFSSNQNELILRVALYPPRLAPWNISSILYILCWLYFVMKKKMADYITMDSSWFWSFNPQVLRCGPPPMNKAMSANLDALGYAPEMQFQFWSAFARSFTLVRTSFYCFHGLKWKTFYPLYFNF